MAATVTKSRRRKTPPTLRFDQRLVLAQWMLERFDVVTIEQLAEDLKSPELEGFDEDNTTWYHHRLRARLFERTELPSDLLLRYDENIVRHWKTITEKRNQAHTLYPKYFQYLSLLFAEVYLERYFQDPDQLLDDMNAYIARFNREHDDADRIEPCAPEDLNKLAFWSATGSGKTLLMHINLLQYRHYLGLHASERDLNRIILLTPNEGLSRQHLEEFGLSGLQAELFSKDGRGLFAGRAVEIIDIHKLREEMGEKTIAIDAFEGNNLVLVDEGHRGSSGVEWKDKRDRLCEEGFSFEYSATFGQAMKAARKPELIQEYAKCILFDYSYKYFYSDGYGKDYRILNLADDSDAEVRQLYLAACLVAFYQQSLLYRRR